VTDHQNGKQATSAVDVLAAAINELRIRGIGEPEQFVSLGADAIIGACHWFDDQRGRVGLGVLVNELRAGGKPGYDARRSSLERQREYGQSIADWLAQKFPDLCRLDERVVVACRECFGDVDADALARDRTPHPAAQAAVARLHQRYGKGQLTVKEHGPEIRAAVRASDEQAIAAYRRVAEQGMGETPMIEEERDEQSA
jgi:hypothetical protein